MLQKLPCHLHDINTIVTSPHKVYGASANDMILQVRQHRIEKIILAGLVATYALKHRCGTLSNMALKSRWFGMPQRELPMKKETVIERRCSVHGQR